MEFVDQWINHASPGVRVISLLAVAGIVHLLVIAIRKVAEKIVSLGKIHQKAHSIITLTTSALVFSLYFFAFGFILQELGVPLTAYLASASVIGLAVGFGSQGIVQDVVMGLTFVFSDLLDVGDLVEVSGQTGKVRRLTMRFVELENAMGATVFIPNRTINNVINYPRGYIRCMVDIRLTGDHEQKSEIETVSTKLMHGIFEQFPGILLNRPSAEGRKTMAGGVEYFRIKFRIWPNRGQPIETTFVKELTSALKKIDPAYEDWMVAVFYEVEEKQRGIR